jgi:threonine aldolase
LPPWGACFCHPHAHIQVDECNAPELFSGGAKLIAVDGANGKLDPEALAAAIRGEGFVHSPQPSLLSISQASELGSVYTLAELAELSAFAKRHRLALHMDGARFANAICALGVSPADLSWRAGVDVLSFGATKNGCLAAEAIVLFDRARASELGFRRKRAGHLLSKLRFLSAQLEAYLLDDLWLSNARHANAMAARLGAGLSALGLPPLAAVEANEIFVAIPESTAQRLRAAQCLFYDWPDLGPAVRRLVTSFETTLEAVDAFIAAVSGSG